MSSEVNSEEIQFIEGNSQESPGGNDKFSVKFQYVLERRNCQLFYRTYGTFIRRRQSSNSIEAS